ncbi:MAG: TM2 domain-containing protein [Mycoplasma sp.]
MLGGWFGLHKWLDKKYIQGYIYLCTGGIYAIWWVYDIMVAYYYMSDGDRAKEKAEEKKTTKNTKRKRLGKRLVRLVNGVIGHITLFFRSNER